MTFPRTTRFFAAAFILATALRTLFFAAIALLAAPFLARPSAAPGGAASAALSCAARALRRTAGLEFTLGAFELSAIEAEVHLDRHLGDQLAADKGP